MRLTRGRRRADLCECKEASYCGSDTHLLLSTPWLRCRNSWYAHLPDLVSFQVANGLRNRLSGQKSMSMYASVLQDCVWCSPSDISQVTCSFRAVQHGLPAAFTPSLPSMLPSVSGVGTNH